MKLVQNIIKRICLSGGLERLPILSALKESLDTYLDTSKGPVERVLIVPPDFTRYHSGAGKLTQLYYSLLAPICKVDILPALGTHFPMTEQEKLKMFGPFIPREAFIDHNWRDDLVTVGQIPEAFVEKVSGGLISYPIEVTLNKSLLDRTYDLVISIGQVVPHEVVGMANYTKNILVGCGGTDLIHKSHMLGAVYGMERLMGRTDSPVRAVFDYAQENFLEDIPLVYCLTVVSRDRGKNQINGLFIGQGRQTFEQAASLSQRLNLDLVKKPLDKVVVYLRPEEFKSTWLGNKAIYRTRMAIKTGGDLIILAPGVRQFGEDSQIDRLILKYGYRGRDQILDLYKTEEDLQANLSVAAHLIHGSSDGRFNIYYGAKHLSKLQIEGVGYLYIDYDEATSRYCPESLEDGFNILPDGEEIFFISNPALGLWALEENFL